MPLFLRERKNWEGFNVFLGLDCSLSRTGRLSQVGRLSLGLDVSLSGWTSLSRAGRLSLSGWASLSWVGRLSWTVLDVSLGRFWSDQLNVSPRFDGLDGSLSG